MNLATNSEQLWLVKSSDRILGPFTTSELSAKISSKEIVLIDEVSAPRSRWKHIRDEPIFAQVVAEVRSKQLASREDTEVGTGTPTISAHVDPEDAIPTQIIVTTADAEQEGQLISETPAPGRTASAASAANPAYSVQSQSRPSQVHDSLSYSPPSATRKSGPLQLVLSLIGIVSLMGAVVFVLKPSLFQKFSGTRQEEIKRLQSQADRAYELGDFQQAARLYERLLKDQSKNTELELRYATLVLRADRDVLDARRRIEAVLPKLLTPELKARGQIALAVAKLQNDEALEARRILDEVVRSAVGGPIAYFNLAAAQMLTGQLDAAAASLEKLDSHASLGLPAMLLKAIIHARQGSPKLALSQLTAGQSGPHFGLAKLSAWRQESLALAAVFEYATATPATVNVINKKGSELMRLAIDSDPYQTEEFFYDPLLYLEPLQWRRWLDLVEDLYLKQKGPQARALYALSLMKAGQLKQGMAVIKEYTQNRSTVETEIQTVLAYGYVLQGQIPEAKAALKLAESNRDANRGTSILPLLLDGRICQTQGDTECADMAWVRVGADSAQAGFAPVISQVGQARMEIKSQPQAKARVTERLKMLYPDSLLVRELLFESGYEHL